jgi:hypothetical protein
MPTVEASAISATPTAQKKTAIDIEVGLSHFSLSRRKMSVAGEAISRRTAKNISQTKVLDTEKAGLINTKPTAERAEATILRKIAIKKSRILGVD